MRIDSEQLPIAALFVVAGALALEAPAHSDTWWLIRAGHDIATNFSIPMSDTYSHTVAGGPWPNHEWLSELTFYALFRLGGLPLLTLVCAASILAATALSWRLTRGEFEWRFLLFGAGVGSATLTWALRPQVFTMACFAASCTLLARGRLRWLPALFLLWANLHGGVALGIVALAAACVADLISTQRVPWRLILVTLLCGLSATATPNGLELWGFVATSVTRLRELQVAEWQAPDASPRFWVFWLLAAALPALALARHRRVDAGGMRLLTIALAMIPLALQSTRNVSMFLLIAVPAATQFVPAERSRRGRHGEHERLNGVIVISGTAIAALITLLAWSRPPDRMGWRPISQAAVSSVRTCPDPIFNTFGRGGELIWFVPEKRVFVDNRQDPYPTDLLREIREAEISGRYEALFTRFGISCAVLPAASPIGDRLVNDKSWRQAFVDDKWRIFAR